jgi:hypothetical protein
MPEYFPSGFYNNMAMQATGLNEKMTGLNEKLDQLNANLKAASASTERLATALNWLTGLGACATFLGVIVGAIELVHRW